MSDSSFYRPCATGLFLVRELSLSKNIEIKIERLKEMQLLPTKLLTCMEIILFLIVNQLKKMHWSYTKVLFLASLCELYCGTIMYS